MKEDDLDTDGAIEGTEARQSALRDDADNAAAVNAAAQAAADADAARGAGDEPESDKPVVEKANAWRSVADKIGDRLIESPEGQDDDDDDDDEKAGERLEDDDEKDEEEEEEEEEDEDKKPALAKAGPDDEDEPRGPRYEIKTAAGDVLELDLEKGTKISFAADGRIVEADSLDDVIELAQKGVAFDRVSSQYGQERSRLGSQIEALEDEIRANEETLLAVITDPEKFKEVRAALKKFADPDYRAGQDALRKIAEHERAEGTESERDRTAAVDEFWTATDATIEASLDKYEFLDSGDLADVKARWYGQYETRLAELVSSYTAAAKANGITEDQAIGLAQSEAAKALNTKTLAATMQSMNDAIARKARRNETPEEKELRERREAAKHNKQVEAKVRQRDTSRTMRSGGAPVGNRGPKAPEPKTFEEKIGRGLAKLRAAGRSGDDE